MSSSSQFLNIRITSTIFNILATLSFTSLSTSTAQTLHNTDGTVTCIYAIRTNAITLYDHNSKNIGVAGTNAYNVIYNPDPTVSGITIQANIWNTGTAKIKLEIVKNVELGYGHVNSGYTFNATNEIQAPSTSSSMNLILLPLTNDVDYNLLAINTNYSTYQQYPEYFFNLYVTTQTWTEHIDSLIDLTQSSCSLQRTRIASNHQSSAQSTPAIITVYNDLTGVSTQTIIDFITTRIGTRLE